MTRFFLRPRIVVLSALLCGALPAGISAQTNFTTTTNESRQPSGGWTITPAAAFATSWDDNVLMKANGDAPVGTNVSAVNPRINADYQAKRTQFYGSYDGSFLIYQNFGSLNSYDQRGSVSLRHMANRRVTFFASNAVAIVPTTELVAFVGIPFVRTGSTIDDAHAGADIALSRHSNLTVTYNFQKVSFDTTPEFANLLRGGHSNGATLLWRRTISDTLKVTADYDVQRSTITERVAGNPIGDFNVHNASGGVEVRLSPNAHAFAAAGIARVGLTAFGPAKTGPALRGGVAYTRKRAGMDVSYSRSFVPSYSFGGTLQNEEIVALLRYMFSRRLSEKTSFSWRSNQSLVANEPNLDSLWFEASLGYSLQNWLRIEGFYIRARQTIDRPGGTLDRNRVGFQIITSNPVRVR